MKLKYEKTHSDRAREISDIRRNPIMRFLKNQSHFKFNIGDIIIKQRRLTLNSEWETEVIAGVNTPKKFMYVFENELGIGYVKQLRADGTGFTTALVCTANFDPDQVRFQLDPDYADHLLIGDDDFEYNKEYLTKKTYREEALKKNMKIAIKTQWHKTRIEWLASLKVGDTFWAGPSWDDMSKYTVTHPFSDVKPLELGLQREGYTPWAYYAEAWFVNMRVTTQEPFPMEDPLCGPAK